MEAVIEAVRAGVERERERETDASATLTRPITGAPAMHGLSVTSFPAETTRSTTPSQLRPGPSPKVPSKPVEDRPQGQPIPDLMYALRTVWQAGYRCLYTIVDRMSTPLCVACVYARQPLRARAGWPDRRPAPGCASRRRSRRAPARRVRRAGRGDDPRSARARTAPPAHARS
jgi:hypothetical protein